MLWPPSSFLAIQSILFRHNPEKLYSTLLLNLINNLCCFEYILLQMRLFRTRLSSSYLALGVLIWWHAYQNATMKPKFEMHSVFLLCVCGGYGWFWLLFTFHDKESKINGTVVTTTVLPRSKYQAISILQCLWSIHAFLRTCHMSLLSVENLQTLNLWKIECARNKSDIRHARRIKAQEQVAKRNKILWKRECGTLQHSAREASVCTNNSMLWSNDSIPLHFDEKMRCTSILEPIGFILAQFICVFLHPYYFRSTNKKTIYHIFGCLSILKSCPHKNPFSVSIIGVLWSARVLFTCSQMPLHIEIPVHLFVVFVKVVCINGKKADILECTRVYCIAFRMSNYRSIYCGDHMTNVPIKLSATFDKWLVTYESKARNLMIPNLSSAVCTQNWATRLESAFVRFLKTRTNVVRQQQKGKNTEAEKTQSKWSSVFSCNLKLVNSVSSPIEPNQVHSVCIKKTEKHKLCRSVNQLSFCSFWVVHIYLYIYIYSYLYYCAAMTQQWKLLNQYIP